MMGFNDIIHYALNNQITKATTDCAWKVVEIFGAAPSKPATPVRIAPPPLPMTLFTQCGNGRYFLRIAAISGSAAVCLGAYGAHRHWALDSLEDKEIHDYLDDADHRKKQFEVANNYHFYHTIALMAVPLARYPLLSGALFTSGMLLFCGPIYYSSVSGNKSYNKLTPFGGVCFIVAWLTLIF